MNFSDVLLSVEIILESGGVPLLVGESGIGKTALVKELSRRLGYYCITVEGNLLKEGEIGGLPVVEDYVFNVDGLEIKRKRTVYAAHTKLQEIDFALMDGEKAVLLFIDEINRCEHTVQQELMNIVLNREINGYVLPDAVKVVAAMNPSSKYNEYNESDYQVIDMDPAQENRFVWLQMESDVKEWLSWGRAGGIHDEVLEFISTFPEYLHTPYSQETVKATPRSWERVSDVYKLYIGRNKNIPQHVLYNILKGNIGGSIAQEFMSFLKDNKNPLIRPEEIFGEEEISRSLKDRVEMESHSRLYLTAKNTLLYMKNKENRKREAHIFADFLQLFPADLKIGIMREIKISFGNDVYPELLEEDVFVDGYFNMVNELSMEELEA
jgi:hypothetical protein